MEYIVRVTRDRAAYHSLLWVVPAVLFVQEVGERDRREYKSVPATTDLHLLVPLTNAVQPQAHQNRVVQETYHSANDYATPKREGTGKYAKTSWFKLRMCSKYWKNSVFDSSVSINYNDYPQAFWMWITLGQVWAVLLQSGSLLELTSHRPYKPRDWRCHGAHSSAASSSCWRPSSLQGEERINFSQRKTTVLLSRSERQTL